MENVRTQRDIKLVKTKARRNYLLLEPNYHTISSRQFISDRNEKIINILE